MKKRLLIFALLPALLFAFALPTQGEESYQKYRYYFFGTFDTIITLTAYTRTQAEFEQYAALVEDEMNRYHRIFDQYHAYEGVRNLYAVNQGVGRAPVRAEPELINLLLLVREWRAAYATVTNPAMGSVLSLWHDAREGGVSLPEEAALREASLHTDYEQVLINREAGTIAFADPSLSLDLGAVAKGYAAQLVADTLRERGLASFLINAGGNVVCGDAPLDGREHWVIGVEDLDGVNIRAKLGLVGVSLVTSGDYQRYFTVDGVNYHHLIDPDTLYPAEHMRAVSVIHPDSGFADFLSTTAFLLPYEESRALIESIPEAEGMWTLMDGTVEMTEGFAAQMALVAQ